MVYWPKQRCQGANSDLELWKLLIATYLSEWAPVSQLGQILQRSGVSWSSGWPFLPPLWEMEMLVQQKPGCWNLLLVNWWYFLLIILYISMYITWHRVRLKIQWSCIDLFYCRKKIPSLLSVLAFVVYHFFPVFLHCSLTSFDCNVKYTAPDTKMTKNWITFLLFFFLVTMVSFIFFYIFFNEFQFVCNPSMYRTPEKLLFSKS